jgi:hypothetical protein
MKGQILDNPLMQAPVLLFLGMMVGFMLVMAFVTIEEAIRRR